MNKGLFLWITEYYAADKKKDVGKALRPIVKWGKQNPDEYVKYDIFSFL